jgi:glycosyltransferase involved in cell wall biosynthesis
VKLIVQIPCYNEEQSLFDTIREIPRQVEGVDRVEVLVIDDGSSDATTEIARCAGADHVVRHPENRGLARAFQTGIDACLRLGADVVVNTDADGQYPAKDIPLLVLPILEGRADIVVGDRRPGENREFSRGKRALQRLGSAVVRRLSGVDVPDAVSGFRAISRRAALRTTILSSFSYTTEQLIQAGNQGLTVVFVPVETRPTARPSRLFRSVPAFLLSTAMTMVRTYTMYRPLRLYTSVGVALLTLGLLPVVRFLYFFFTEGGQGHVQSLVLGAAFLILGFMTFLVGVVAELVAVNRRLIELTIERLRRLELEPERQPTADSPQQRSERSFHG